MKTKMTPNLVRNTLFKGRLLTAVLASALTAGCMSGKNEGTGGAGGMGLSGVDQNNDPTPAQVAFIKKLQSDTAYQESCKSYRFQPGVRFTSSFEQLPSGVTLVKTTGIVMCDEDSFMLRAAFNVTRILDDNTVLKSNADAYLSWQGTSIDPLLGFGGIGARELFSPDNLRTLSNDPKNAPFLNQVDVVVSSEVVGGKILTDVDTSLHNIPPYSMKPMTDLERYRAAVVLDIVANTMNGKQTIKLNYEPTDAIIEQGAGVVCCPKSDLPSNLF